MLKIYLDSDFVCHLTDDGTRREYYTGFFAEDTPEKFIEGYRIVPADSTWTRKDGVVFHGEMVSPAVDYSGLERVKEQHEIDDEKHTQELGALIDEIYAEDLDIIG